MEIWKRFRFDAAHRLPAVPEGHPCGRLHGHSFEVEVRLRGPVDPAAGWVVDFADIAAAFEPLRRQLDHARLNDITGLENPTCENIARWLWTRLAPDLPDLVEISVWETPDAGARFDGRA